MTIYQKVIAAFGVLRSSIMQRAEKSAIAPTFSESVVYSKGRLVYRGDTLYRCTVDHSGLWDQSHFAETTIDEVLSMKGDAGIPENLYAREASTGLFYKISIEDSDGIKTIAVDQNGISGMSSAVEQNGMTR